MAATMRASCRYALHPLLWSFDLCAQAVICHGKVVRAVAAGLAASGQSTKATLDVAFEQLDAMYDIRDTNQ